MILLKGTLLKGKHEIQDLGKILYITLWGNHMQSCWFSRLPQLKGKVRLKLYTETSYSHIEATLKGVLRMREVDEMLMEIRIASWQSF